MDETLKLTPNRAKWMFLTIMFVGLAVGMALLYVYSDSPKTDESLFIVAGFVLFFLAGGVLCTMMLLPNRVYLLLTPRNFTLCTLFKSWSFRWEEVEECHTLSVKGTDWVVYKLAPQGKLRYTENRLRKLGKTLTGGDGSLPDTYGMRAEDLAELMNQWKKRSAAGR